MIELLQTAAAREPDRPAVIAGERATTFRQLAGDAEQVAAGLRHRSIDRFGIRVEDAAIAVALLAGASLAGAEACIYPPIDSPTQATDLAARLDHNVVVWSGDDPPAGLDTVSPAELVAGARSAPPPAPPPARPLLVLTTGTTGAPRGVRHDWSRVLRSVAHIHPTPDRRWLLAYGLAQFAGLQVLVHVLAAQATLVAPFPRRPRDGLAAMRRHAVDSASATPTFWRFVLAELLQDGGPVPALRQITLGGEAVPDHVLADLRAAFPRARISQIYAANESGSLRAVRDGRPGLPVSLLDAGDDADLALKIVAGELWVRSRIGMLGYHGEAPVDADGWRATGDLVEVRDGRVMFRGRSSDIINVGGVKVHPLPIEERIGAVPGVALSRVYGRPNPVTGAIVAAEVVAAPDADTAQLDAAIRAACADLPTAARPRSLRFVDAVTTTGHKIGRGAGHAR